MTPAMLSMLFWSALLAAGQSNGATVGGIVTDESGARLPDATVTLALEQSGRVLTVTTGREGEYRAVALLPGTYDLAAARSGFSRVTRRVTLFVGGDATVNFTLPLAGLDAVASIVAEVPLVEAARSQPSSTITTQQLETLPVLDRNFLVLAQLLPGSGPINSTVTRFAVTKFGGVADQRSGYTTLVDGGDVDDAQWGNPTINVGQDAIQEFKVFRGQFDAQYGHALNAVVSVATRSGTNGYAGSGFYFGRDAALNARNPFATAKPPFDEQRIGGSLGGRIVWNRSHFFAAYEFDNLDNVRIIALPSNNPLAASENGVFPAASDDSMATMRLNHRLTPSHAASLRYNHDYQRSLRANVAPTSDTSQTDVFNRSDSLVFEETWTPLPSAANAFRVHVLSHTLGTHARSSNVGIIRPAGSLGQTNRDSQLVPRTKLELFDMFYFHAVRHDVKFGVESAFARQDLDSHVFEDGVFRFATDAPFNPVVPATWPISFEQQKPSVVTYASTEFSCFLQDDWRFANRIRVNAGVRYDLDLNLRINDFYARMLDDPNLVHLDRFISGNRGTDTNNVQPRLGATWDARGDGRVIVRGGSGLYVTRNRPWFQLRAMNQAVSSVVRITDPMLLRRYPDVDGVLDRRSLDSFVATGGPRQLGTVIPDRFVQPYAVNVTAGVGWQPKRATAVDVDYVHSFGNHQTGSTDRNLPDAGSLSAMNPRPVPQFSQVMMLENYTRSWYDAMEAQFRVQASPLGTLQASYTLSRTYLDGVDFFLTTRGTQRTPRERGYNATDQRHNLTIAGTVTLPWDVQLAGVIRLVSGSPIKVQAGLDLDGDSTVTGDLPSGIPITIGRERVSESLAAIDHFRESLGLAPVDGHLLTLDPYRSLDLRIVKSLGLGGSRRRLELLIEGYNLTNHVNFRPPVAAGQPEAGVSINTASFLIRTSARDARQVQWGGRYRF